MANDSPYSTFKLISSRITKFEFPEDTSFLKFLVESIMYVLYEA